MTVLDAHLVVALGSFDLDLELRRPAGVTGILGPNGSGKTTALKALAGLLPLDRGHVRVAGGTWAAERTALPPEQRSVGLVLAEPMLFPHLSLLDNVAYGPRARGARRAVARERAAEELTRVGLEDLVDRRPSQVSSGQAQRAALARALATDPALLLLDEPLSALDPQTRTATRAELAHRLRDYPGTTVLVSHDPLDALTLADELLFVDAGRLVQSGTPAEIVARPRSPYVAGVVGLNLLRGTLALGGAPTLRLAGGAELVLADAPAGVPDGADVLATVNPAAVTLYTDRPTASARNLWQVEVGAVTVTGQRARVVLHGIPGNDLVAEVTLPAVAQLGVVAGARLWAGVKATEVEAYPD
ncbi:ABC transporter ATP-binding protein [Ornithinimicrobium humiphilum]|uniref:Molybdate transport system ATP-binding protein n=1 Tax=Ornithinimicrobium humiphilum TaxID=125288 RepID=A0A543KRQ3_9MICO|nr:ABC transporter ATP-binding protein [Ornithinimicrobium humiphilum]TQM97749.1 molybdate transport system ATP-binding protein [Ornithinimicrobium humiphilum]